MASYKQIEYIHALWDRLENDGNDMTNVLCDLGAKYAEHEDFDDWLKRQTVSEASQIIEYLKKL